MAGSRKDRLWPFRRGSRRPPLAGRNRRRPRVEELESYVLLSLGTVTVTTAGDDGRGDIQGSLSWAIDQVNGDSADSSAQPDTIAFHIGRAGPSTIAPTGALPAITKPVVIDGSTQPLGPGTNVRDAIRIDGTHAGAGTSGLVLAAGSDGSSVLGLSITDFSEDGILLESGSNTVAGDDIGVDQAGSVVAGNTVEGVAVSSSYNTIGGTTASALNVISGNLGAGVAIYGSGATYNDVWGNDIGTDATGASITTSGGAPLGNGTGVALFDGANNNVIGGVYAGEPNVISGNIVNSKSYSDGVGVIVEGTGTDDNLVESNLIGTDVTGTIALGNATDGVQVALGASNNSIDSNTIAGNQSDGVDILDASANAIDGNYIGTNAHLDTGLGNVGAGVSLYTDTNLSVYGGAASNSVEYNIVTGSGTSANFRGGVVLAGTGTSYNLLALNTISNNHYNGVDIFGGATDNTIGGTTLTSNTITNNGWGGVEISGTGTSSNVVAGDYIGTDSSGDPGLGNGLAGVSIYGGATDNTIGGVPVVVAAVTFSPDVVVRGGSVADTIVSNGGDGVDISGSGTSGNVVEGDYIGTDANSDTGLGNTYDGVDIYGGASGNTIGGPTSAALNVISGNGNVGVEVFDGGASGNTIEGNYIGTTVSSEAALANSATGVLIGSDGTAGEPSTNNTVVDNVISGNGESGVAIENASGNLVEDNRIGTDADGTAAVGNTWNGVRLTEYLSSPSNIGTGSADNTIVDNTISANGYYGVLIEYAGSTGNLVAGNAIGTVAGNILGGVMIDLGASGNTIGGSAANVLSGNGTSNGGDGVDISGAGTSGNVVAGNFIGVLADGKTGLDNMGDGVAIGGGATGNTVGGTTSADANTIANNTGNGVSIADSGTTGNVVEGNFIGTNSAGATNIGNGGDGVRVFNAASGNTVGGTAAGSGDVIAYNLKGVVVGSSATDTSHDDAILGNSIFANTDLGIDLGDDGVTPNDSEGHTGPNLFQDFPAISSAELNSGAGTTVITGTVEGPKNSTVAVQLYANPATDPASYGQGQTFLGSLQVAIGAGGTGTFTFTTTTPLAVGQVVSATATDASGDTSEFAQDVAIVAASDNVTSEVSIKQSGFSVNRRTHQYSQTVTITNTSGSTIAGPIYLELANLTGGVTLASPSSTPTSGANPPAGSPAVEVSSSSLGAGQSVSVTLVFNNPNNFVINYTPEVLGDPNPL